MTMAGIGTFLEDVPYLLTLNSVAGIHGLNEALEGFLEMSLAIEDRKLTEDKLIAVSGALNGILDEMDEVRIGWEISDNENELLGDLTIFVGELEDFIDELMSGDFDDDWRYKDPMEFLCNYDFDYDDDDDDFGNDYDDDDYDDE